MMQTIIDILQWDYGQTQFMTDLANRVSELQRTQPTTSDGLPLAYVDASLLLDVGADGAGTDSDAIVPLLYGEGFAVAGTTGAAFWDRLDGEPVAYYNLFKDYQLQKEQRGVRSLSAVCKTHGVQFAQVSALSKIYHWQLRAKCYDAYVAMQREAARYQAMLQMEGKHRQAAQKIFRICLEFLEKNVKALTPKVALDWFKTAVELERLSLGLDPNKPAIHQIKPPQAPQTQPNSPILIQACHVSAADLTPEQQAQATELQEILDILSRAGVNTLDPQRTTLRQAMEQLSAEP